MEESLVLVPIVLEHEMSLQVPSDMPHLVFKEALSVTNKQMPFFAEALEHELQRYRTGNSIDMATVCRVTRQTNFLKEVDLMMEGRDPSTNINLFKAALYLHAKDFLKISQIKSAITNYTVANREFLEAGLPTRADVLMKVLRVGNRFICDKVLELWLSHCKSRLSTKNKLTIWEFLFLFSNSSERDRLFIEKLPRPSHKLVKNSSNTYQLEQDLSSTRVPDKWLNSHLNSIIDTRRVHFYTASRRQTRPLRRKGTKLLKKISILNSAPATDLQRTLRSPTLYQEIKSTLTQGRQRLKSAGNFRSASNTQRSDTNLGLCASQSTKDFQIHPILVKASTSCAASLKSHRSWNVRPSTAVHRKTRSTCVRPKQLDLPSKEVYRRELIGVRDYGVTEYRS
jgi:hypothetical protein